MSDFAHCRMKRITNYLRILPVRTAPSVKHELVNVIPKYVEVPRTAKIHDVRTPVATHLHHDMRVP
jgi:hypothetical protein